MKSAVELALEKTGGDVKELADDVKEKIARVESEYKAKVAEAELAFNEKLVKASNDPAQVEQIKADLNVEMASLRSKRDRDKERIRG